MKSLAVQPPQSRAGEADGRVWTVLLAVGATPLPPDAIETLRAALAIGISKLTVAAVLGPEAIVSKWWGHLAVYPRPSFADSLDEAARSSRRVADVLARGISVRHLASRDWYWVAEELGSGRHDELVLVDRPRPRRAWRQVVEAAREAEVVLTDWTDIASRSCEDA